MITVNGRPIESAAYKPESERAVMPKPETQVKHKDANSTSNKRNKSKATPKS